MCLHLRPPACPPACTPASLFCFCYLVWFLLLVVPKLWAFLHVSTCVSACLSSTTFLHVGPHVPVVACVPSSLIASVCVLLNVCALLDTPDLYLNLCMCSCLCAVYILPDLACLPAVVSFMPSCSQFACLFIRIFTAPPVSPLGRIWPPLPNFLFACLSHLRVCPASMRARVWACHCRCTCMPASVCPCFTHLSSCPHLCPRICICLPSYQTTYLHVSLS